MIYRPTPAPLKHFRAGFRPPAPVLRALPALLLALALLPGCGSGQEGGTGRGRPALTREGEAAAARILIRYAGATGAPDTLQRTRPEAEELALYLAAEIRDGADFATLARRYSEEPNVERTGGYVGIFLPGDLDLDFDAAVMSLEIGQIMVHESPYGFEVIERLPVERAEAHHILIAWRGAEQAGEAVTRTEPQAEALAREVRRLAVQPGADLCELARKYSDDARSRVDCGRIGVVEPRMLPRAFDEALFRLHPGQVSEVVRTAYGFHIIWRK